MMETMETEYVKERIEWKQDGNDGNRALMKFGKTLNERFFFIRYE